MQPDYCRMLVLQSKTKMVQLLLWSKNGRECMYTLCLSRPRDIASPMAALVQLTTDHGLSLKGDSGASGM